MIYTTNSLLLTTHTEKQQKRTKTFERPCILNRLYIRPHIRQKKPAPKAKKQPHNAPPYLIVKSFYRIFNSLSKVK